MSQREWKRDPALVHHAVHLAVTDVVAALPNMNVAVTDAAGDHFQQYLAALWLRYGTAPELERVSKRGKTVAFHICKSERNKCRAVDLEPKGFLLVRRSILRGWTVSRLASGVSAGFSESRRRLGIFSGQAVLAGADGLRDAGFAWRAWFRCGHRSSLAFGPFLGIGGWQRPARRRDRGRDLGHCAVGDAGLRSPSAGRKRGPLSGLAAARGGGRAQSPHAIVLIPQFAQDQAGCFA